MKKDYTIARDCIDGYSIHCMKDFFVSNIYSCFHLIKDFPDALIFRENMQKKQFGHRSNATKGMVFSWLKAGEVAKAVEECDYSISYIENDLHNNPFSLNSSKMEKDLLEIKEIKKNITIDQSYYIKIIDSIISEKKLLIDTLFGLK